MLFKRRGQELSRFHPDHVVTLAAPGLQTCSFEHGYLAARATNEVGIPGLPRCLCNNIPAHAKHVRDELPSHRQLISGESIQAQQQPRAQLLVDEVVAIANRRLRHLRQ
jgi:hypothetical protein